MRHMRNSCPRPTMSPSLLLVAFLSAACALAAPSGQLADVAHAASGKHTPPDFSKYIDMRTLNHSALGLDDPKRRMVFVGDVHGMRRPLLELLDKISYDPRHDAVVHTGDIITKGDDSLGVLEWLSSHNILGVRGNQDQKVIEWRGWIEWVESQRGGRKWLRKMERKYPDGVDGEEMKSHKKDKKFGFPDDWTFNGEHYVLARDMAAEHYQYLLQLPLNLHLVPLHTFVGHAGVLPMDPTRSPTARRQPLAHVPDVDFPDPDTELLRLAQETAIMREIPQNTDPWTKLNIRSILRDGTVTRDGTEGAPWSDLWNAIVDKCQGFEAARTLPQSSNSQLVMDNVAVDANGVVDTIKPALRLPCHPASVVYGHAASRGLDIKRWTKGLDTGCVYGRRLTAMVVDNRQHVDYDSRQIEFGEDGSAHLVSVDCS